ADVRVWFFRKLARSAAGGLGFRQAGDVLARLVGDIEALDGLYLRILVPLAGAVLLLPALALLIGLHSGLLAVMIGALFAVAAVAGAFLVVAAFETAGALPRAGILAGHVAAAARRVLTAAEAKVPVPDPQHPAALPTGWTLRFEGVHFGWLPDRPPVLDGL